MDDDEGGPRLSKRFSDKGGEVDLQTKSGTAWSHSFLNQKPWHPLSYPNQRRKWIAEQTHVQHQRRSEEIAREYAQEQEFLRQTSLLSQKEKDKVDVMQAVSFMYVRPPGYNAESAKAAEIADERKKLGEICSSSVPQEVAALMEEKKKARPKDVFGRTLPTEEEFAVLKNAPRLETGVTGRVKPFAVEVRNVKCVRCGTFGHQSGDRECPLKDAIMPNDESRLKRDDPLTAIMAQMDTSEPLKWELKQKPGISPPRGGFQPDDPNQQIVAEDIFDEYGGFLSAGVIPELLASLSSTNHNKKSKSKRHRKNVSHKKYHEGNSSSSDSDNGKRRSKMRSKSKSKELRASRGQSHDGNSPASNDDNGKRILAMKVKSSSKHKKRASYLDSDQESDSTFDNYEHKRRSRKKHTRNKRNKKDLSYSSMSEEPKDEKYHVKSQRKDSRQFECACKDKNCLSHGCKKSKVSHEDNSSDGKRKSSRQSEKCRNKMMRGRQDDSEFSSSDNSESERHKRKHKHSFSSKGRL